MFTESRQPVFKLISPKEAETFLALNNFPGQRAYKPELGKKYADQMDAGTQRRIEIGVAKVRETGIDYMVNGQHNCNAIIIRNKPYPAVISYFSCDTMEEAWRLFGTYDTHSARTEQQFMRSRRGIFSDERLHEMPLRLLQCCGTALYFLGSGVEPQFNSSAAMNKTIKADMVEKFAEDVLFAHDFNEFVHLMNVGTVCAMIATKRKNTKASREFWEKVGNGEMLGASDPRKKLREGLLSGKFLGEAGGSRRHKSTYAFCVSWWNAWRAGEPRKSVKIHAMQSVPKVSG